MTYYSDDVLLMYISVCLLQTVPRADAIFNISRVALLVNALATGALHNLGKCELLNLIIKLCFFQAIAMDDRMHQNYRAAVATGKHVFPLIASAIRAGAHGSCLSGSGTTGYLFLTFKYPVFP